MTAIAAARDDIRPAVGIRAFRRLAFIDGMSTHELLERPLYRLLTPRTFPWRRSAVVLSPTRPRWRLLPDPRTISPAQTQPDVRSPASSLAERQWKRTAPEPAAHREEPLHTGDPTGPSELDSSRRPAPEETLSSLVLLAQVRQGEAAALDALIRRYWPRLERWARGRLPARARDLHDTGDLVQETMVTALGRLDEFVPQHDGALLAYLRMACLNRIRSLIRGSAASGQKVDLESGLLDWGHSPLEQAIGTEAVERYERALARLRPEDRDAICAKVELDLPYEEIANALGKPTITAARMTVSRALARLAREMQRNA